MLTFIGIYVFISESIFNYFPLILGELCAENLEFLIGEKPKWLFTSNLSMTIDKLLRA